MRGDNINPFPSRLLPITRVHVDRDAPWLTRLSPEAEHEPAAVGRSLAVPVAADDVADGIAGRVRDRAKAKVASRRRVRLPDRSSATDPATSRDETVFGEEGAQS